MRLRAYNAVVAGTRGALEPLDLERFPQRVTVLLAPGTEETIVTDKMMILGWGRWRVNQGTAEEIETISMSLTDRALLMIGLEEPTPLRINSDTVATLIYD